MCGPAPDFKLWQYLAILLMIAGTLNSYAQPCNHIIPPKPETTTIIDPQTYPDIKHGDVVCLDAGTFHQILIRNLHGTPDQPITFRNASGQSVIHNEAHYGISVRNSSFLHITGDGVIDIPYGIKISKVGGGSGISLDQLTTNVTISHVEVSNTALAGIIAKTDPDCSFTSLRDVFTMYDIAIHNCYLHNIGMEGLYIGSSFYNGFTLQCNGVDTVLMPHVIVGVEVFDNIIHHTGRNGLQINSVVENCRIFNNQIVYDSQSETHNQMGGIQIGGGSSCDCFNNHIAHGKGSGIEVFGKGNMLIYNNLIEYPGRSFKPDVPHYEFPKHGIFIKDVNTDPNSFIHLFNNTIIYPKSNGVLLNNPFLESSRIQNNIVVNPGSYAEIGTKAYVNDEIGNAFVANNLFTSDISFICFADHFNQNYSLAPKSPAIDKGADVGAFGIDFDFNNSPRPKGAGYDIGAFEFDPENFDPDKPTITILPNPFSNYLIIEFCMENVGDISLHIVDLQGKSVFHGVIRNVDRGSHRKEFILEKMRSGVYLVTFNTPQHTLTKRMFRVKQ